MEERKNQVLYEQLINGDESALEKIYKLYKAEFVNFFKRYEISQQEVLDIYQDSIIVIYQKFVTEKTNLSKSSIKTYLFGIGKNKVYNHFKTKKITTSEIKDLEIRDREFQLKEEPSAYEKLLAKNLKSISDSCRNILELFYYKNFTIKEIVLITDYKDENTVKSHKSRCLKTLKSLCKQN